MMFRVVAGLRCICVAALSVVAPALPVFGQAMNQPVVVPTGSQPVAVYAADVNGDGNPDLVVVDGGATAAGSTTRVLLGDGKGGFTQSAVLATAGTSVAVGDFDGDGKVDVAWLKQYPGYGAPGNVPLYAMYLARGNGDGTFAAATTQGGFPTITGTTTYSLGYLTAARLHPTGGLDIVFEDTTRGVLYTGNTGGTTDFIKGTNAFTLPSGGQNGTGPMTVTDLNGDGLNDVVILTPSGEADAYVATGNGFWSAPKPFASATPPASLLFSKVDGGGKADALTADASGRVDIYQGNGDGSFAASSEVGSGASDAATGHGGQLVGVADLNRDGVADLITATAPGVSVLLGQPGLSYKLLGMYDAGPGRTSFALADFNRDGHLDLAVDTPGGVKVLFGRADGSFAAAEVVTGTLAAAPEPSLYGDTFTLTATLTPTGTTPATGTVIFEVDGLVVGTVPVANNTASYAVVAPTYYKGTHTITALYSGDTNYAALTLNGTHVISGLRSETDFTVTTPTIYYGDIAGGQGGVTPIDTAVGASVIGGTITFYDGSKALCVLTVSATPQDCPPDVGTGFSVGTHVLYATYSGNQYYEASTSPQGTVVVLPDPTTGALASSLNPSMAGQAVTLTAHFTSPFGVPTGTVTFLDGSAALGAAALDASGNASLTIATLGVGTHTLTAVLAASQNFNGSVTGPVAQVVLPAVSATTTALSSSANPSLIGQPVTFTATVTAALAGVGVPAGNVAINIDGVVVTTVPLDASGTAQYVTSSLTLGSHTVIASYAGSPRTLASTSATLTQVVNAPLNYAGGGYTLTITPAKLAVPIGSYGRATVTVTPIAGFNQTVALSCADMPYAGTCSFANPALVAGSYTTTLTVFATAPHDCGNNTPYFVASGPGAGVGALAFMALTLPLWRRRKLLRGIVLVAALAVLPMLGGCGSCTDLGVKPGDYSFTATAKADAGTKTQVVRFTAHL